MEAITGFDPSVHGYHFTNRFSGKDVVDELVEQRRLDEFIGVDLPSSLPSRPHAVNPGFPASYTRA